MSASYVDGFLDPHFGSNPPLLRARGLIAFVRASHCLAKLSLSPLAVAWRAERRIVYHPDSSRALPRPIRFSVEGSLWVSGGGRFVAELLPAEAGGLLVSARDGETGRELWQRVVLPPDAAPWAEADPAWPGAATEEIDAFFADDPDHLVLCLHRQSRRSGMVTAGVNVMTMPPYFCQTDATRFDLTDGSAVWLRTFPDVHVSITGRDSFDGLWSSAGGRVGLIDFATGANTVLHESPHRVGRPVRFGAGFAVSWHSPSSVGVDWLDNSGRLLRSASWRLRVQRTQLHPTTAGVILQTKDQRLWLVGDEDVPLWDVRVKQPVYRVFQAASSRLLVGTDGNGGRLLGFDLLTGQELLNLRPTVGGAGDLAKVPGHDVLVCPFGQTRSYSKPPRLVLLDARSLRHETTIPVEQLVGVWQHGAVCSLGARLAVLDVRAFAAGGPAT